MFKKAIIRPLRILFLSPIVILLSLYNCVVYAYIYIIATTITEIFETEYNSSQGPVGLTFLGIGKLLLYILGMYNADTLQESE